MQMESIDTAACFMDDLLDFSSDIGEEEEEDEEHHAVKPIKHRRHPPSSFPFLPTCPSETTPPFPEFVEEELEWISNKDAFPMVESFVDIMPNHPSITGTHQSPVSVLENSSSSINSGASSHVSSSTTTAISALSNVFKVPGKARSRSSRKRRRDMFGQQWYSWAQQHYQQKAKANSSSTTSGYSSKVAKTSSTVGRKCMHCQAEKTPQWRAGPLGPKTLCNACGVRYKSGRLVPEYRPASSPTYSSELHSNSHRKIVEMRRQKMMTIGSMGAKNGGLG